MQHKFIDFSSIEAFSKRDVDYQLNPSQFESFYKYTPDLDGLIQSMSDRAKVGVDRELLVGSLTSQYQAMTLSQQQSEALLSLGKESTLTVITAHQPSLFTGPLYFMTKIFSVITLANQLNTVQNDYRIVPVFILGAEDHDFEEVNHLSVFGKKVTWESGQSGAVGRMTLQGISATMDEYFQILGDGNEVKQLQAAWSNAMEGATTYADLMQRFLMEFFKSYPVLVAQMDRPEFKRAFIPYMQREIAESLSKITVPKTQQKLSEIGYSEQAFVRDINLFYLSGRQRSRLEKVGDTYVAVDTTFTWTYEQLMAEMESSPEKFSPNVVTRPLYQEVIWPNIAYVGGGGELAYWLERKTQFEAFGVFYPALIRRNSFLILNASQSKSLQKFGFTIEDLFEPTHQLIRDYLDRCTQFDLSLQSEVVAISKAFDAIAEKAHHADTTLKGLVESEKTKMVKQIEQIEGRITRSVKKTEEVAVAQIEKLKEKLFPNNGLQERTDHFFQFFTTIGSVELMEYMISLSNPLEKRFVVIYD